MRAKWIEIKRGDVLPQFAGLYVTMNMHGNIKMSRVTYELMGSPKAFNLLYDKTNNRIGLKPCALATRNAYLAAVAGPTGSKQVRAHRLVAEHRIDLPYTVQFTDAEIDEDGTLVLDIRTAKESARAVAQRARRATE
jgi:hypothetical protein